MESFEDGVADDAAKLKPGEILELQLDRVLTTEELTKLNIHITNKNRKGYIINQQGDTIRISLI